MSQNGHTHFKNLAANADNFKTLCVKRLTASCKMMKNCQTYLKNLAVFTRQDF